MLDAGIPPIVDLSIPLESPSGISLWNVPAGAELGRFFQEFPWNSHPAFQAGSGFYSLPVPERREIHGKGKMVEIERDGMREGKGKREKGKSQIFPPMWFSGNESASGAGKVGKEGLWDLCVRNKDRENLKRSREKWE